MGASLQPSGIAETREKSSPDLELRIRGNQVVFLLDSATSKTFYEIIFFTIKEFFLIFHFSLFLVVFLS